MNIFISFAGIKLRKIQKNYSYQAGTWFISKKVLTADYSRSTVN